MNRRWATVFLLLLLAPAAHPCTTFCMTAGDRVVFGDNYDWETRVGVLMVNKRAMARESLTQRPFRWTSRYASITFNQYGRGFPIGGMNEAGLVVAIMDLDASEYPQVDERPSAGILDWIQYQLDVSGDIHEAMINASAIRVATGSRRVHYLIADRTGHAVTIEYLGGVLVTHSGTSLPVQVLANSRYDESLAYLGTITGFGGSQPVPSGPGSLQRFALVASMIRATSPGADSVDRAFTILESVRQVNTKWSIVYEPAVGRVNYRTDVDRAVRSVSFTSFDLDCNSPVKILDLNSPLEGDLGPYFTDYSAAANLALINAAYDSTPSIPASQEARLMRAAHAEKEACLNRPRTRVARP